jgi:nucleoside-diphosphate-sugar epimerase
MIIGSGFLARTFAPMYSRADDITIFASGVSNSDETRLAEFERERSRLAQAIAGDPGHLVYFSTCSVVDPELGNTPYVRHKLDMEQLASSAASYSVFRLPQVIGRTSNPNTLANYFRDRITSGRRFSVWKNAWRYIIDVDDVAKIAVRMIGDRRYWKRTLNIASPHAVRVVELVQIFESVLGVAADYEEIDRGGSYKIDVSEVTSLAEVAGVRFGDAYVYETIRKYYGHP